MKIHEEESYFQNIFNALEWVNIKYISKSLLGGYTCTHAC